MLLFTAHLAVSRASIPRMVPLTRVADCAQMLSVISYPALARLQGTHPTGLEKSLGLVSSLLFQLVIRSRSYGRINNCFWIITQTHELKHSQY